MNIFQLEEEGKLSERMEKIMGFDRLKALEILHYRRQEVFERYLTFVSSSFNSSLSNFGSIRVLIDAGNLSNNFIYKTQSNSNLDSFNNLSSLKNISNCVKLG